MKRKDPNSEAAEATCGGACLLLILAVVIPLLVVLWRWAF